MASFSRRSIRRIAHGAALAAGLLISAQSTSARALPAPGAPAPAPYVYAPPPLQLGAPRPEYPTYVYLDQEGSPGVPVMAGMPAIWSKRYWYGWQTLLVFGGSTTVGLIGGFAGGASGSAGVIITGLSVGSAGLLLGGPIIHWAHGHTARGFGVLGLNFGMPLVSAGLGIGITCAAGGCSGHASGFGIFFGSIIGGSFGLLGAMIVDVAALSYEPSAPVAGAASRKAPTWTLLPDLKITREKTTFGFAGVF